MSAAPGWVAFLRGVNVGGKRKVLKADLVALVAAWGAESVRTYLQSGNVAFRAPPELVKDIEQRFEERARQRFGFVVQVVVRSGAELRAVLENNPFLQGGADTKSLHVAFLRERPTERAVAALDPQRSPPDAFAVHGRDVYLHLPNGMARTKLTSAYLDATLGTLSTARNWRTVGAVSALVEG